MKSENARKSEFATKMIIIFVGLQILGFGLIAIFLKYLVFGPPSPVDRPDWPIVTAAVVFVFIGWWGRGTYEKKLRHLSESNLSAQKNEVDVKSPSCSSIERRICHSEKNFGPKAKGLFGAFIQILALCLALIYLVSSGKTVADSICDLLLSCCLMYCLLVLLKRFSKGK